MAEIKGDELKNTENEQRIKLFSTKPRRNTNLIFRTLQVPIYYIL